MDILINNYMPPKQQWLFTIYKLTVPNYTLKTLGFPETHKTIIKNKIKGLGKCLSSSALIYFLFKIKKVKIKPKQKIYYYENAKPFQCNSIRG